MKAKPIQDILVLVPFPLTADMAEQLTQKLKGRISHRSLTELRRMSPPKLLKFLLRQKPNRLVIPTMDDNAQILLPILLLIASLSQARSIECVDRDYQVRRYSRFEILKLALSLLGASARGLTSVGLEWIKLRSLIHADRVETPPAIGRDVLYLKTNLWFGVAAGGSVGHIAGVVNGFLKRGYRIRFAAAETPAMVGNVTLHRIQPPSLFGLPYEVNHYMFQRGFLKQLLELDLRSVSFIYQRLSQSNYLGVQMSRALRVPLILEYNGSEVWVAQNWGRRLLFPKLALMTETACLKHAHLIVTVSDPLRRELITRGVPPERIVCYPNCIDPDIFEPTRFSLTQRLALRAEHGIAPDATLITFVGTFGQWHGVTFLAEAIRHLILHEEDWLKKHKVHFMMVGDGLKMPEVRSILDPLADRGYFTLAGLVPQTEAPLHLAASDILVSPHVPNGDGTEFFGSPTKLFEYMAMEKAIIASSLGQMGDVLRPGPDGSPAILFEPGNMMGFLQGIRTCVEQPALRQRLGRTARSRALSLYTWDHHVSEILKAAVKNSVLESVLSKPQEWRQTLHKETGA